METGGTSRWRCGNRDCGWSMAKLELGDDDGAPRCICGQEMQLVPRAPGGNYLGFLREAADAAAQGEERE